MPFNSLTPEEQSLLAESPSLIGRAGEQLANAIPETANDVTRLFFNLGVQSPGQTKPLEFPKPYDIPPAKTTGEGLIDLGAGLGRAAPLIASGEGIGAGLSELAGAGKALSSVIGSATGFGVQGLTQDKTQGALGAASGALWGLSDVLPGKAKYAAAGLLGLLSGKEEYDQTGDTTKAVTQGVVNAALPSVFRGVNRFLKGKTPDKPSSPDIPSDTPPPIPPSDPFQLEQQAVVPEGSMIEHPRFSENEALTIARSQEAKANAAPQIPLTLSDDLELPFQRNGNGSAESTASTPSVSPYERELPFNRNGGTSAPEGSMIREPVYSEAEAQLFGKNRLQQEVATLQPNTVLTAENLPQVSEHLGLQKPYVDPNYPSFASAADPTHGGNIDMPIGATVGELKTLKNNKAEQFALPKKAESVTRLRELQDEASKVKQGIKDRLANGEATPTTTVEPKTEVATSQSESAIPPREPVTSVPPRPPTPPISPRPPAEPIPPSPSKNKFKLGNNGQAGYAQQDVVNSIAKYAVSATIGGAIGASISDPDKRTQNAILFALGAIGIAKASPKLLEMFARSHPDIAKAGSFPATVKELAKGVGDVVTASDRAAAKASTELGSATGFEKIARWLNRRFTVAPEVQKGLDKAHGLVDDISKIIEKGQLVLANSALTPGHLANILDYYEGKITAKELEEAIGNNQISKAATDVRTSADTLQAMIEKSLPDGPLKTEVRDSFGKYLTETFKIFHDPAYYPTEQQIRKVAKMLPGGDQENNVTILRDYLNSIKANRGIYGVTPAKKGYGAALGAILRTKEPIMSQAFKEMLGVYDSPMEQMAATAKKLITGARTAEFFNQMSNANKDNGLKMVYTYEEMSANRDAISTQLGAARLNGQSEKVATLQSQLDDLNTYLYNAPNAQHGNLSDKFIDRRVHDSLMTYDSILTQSGSPINKAITDVTNAVKYAHTVASPLQFARQVFSMPFLGALAKTGPTDWWKAYQSLFNNPEELQRLRKLGLTYGDSVSGMLRKDFSEMLKGKFDQLVTNRTIRNGISTWEELYRTPDLITRVAAFQKQEAKLLAEGLSPDMAADKAIDFANMFAMNYGMAPKGIQIIRKIPFVNQYLTFAYEIARITKNLAGVALGGKDPHGIGRPYALGILTAFATAPLIIQKLTESQLSPKDLADWKKAEGLLPDYARSNFKFVTGRDAKGNFNYIDFTPIIVHDKWMKMARDIGNTDWEAIKADNPIFGWENTPLLNVATNQITGQDQHTGQKLQTIGERIDSIRRDILPPLIGTDLDKIVQALTPNAQGSLGVTDLRTGKTSSISSIIGSYITSLRSYSVNPSVLEQRAISDATTQTANARAYFYRVMRSDSRQDVKQAAASYYQMTQKQILMSLRDKLRKQTADNYEGQ